MNTRRKAARKIALLLLLAALLPASCSGGWKTVMSVADHAETEESSTVAKAAEIEAVHTPEPSAASETSAEPDLFSAALDEIRGLIKDGSYYTAFQKIVALEAEHKTDADKVSDCEALFGEMDKLLLEAEPKSGTELSRSFSVQGGGVLEVNAFSGPVLVTVTDEYAVREGNPNPSSVTFYVRKGEHGQTNLPAGTYSVRYQVGYRWFGEQERFGEYFTEGALEAPLVFDFYMDGQWASNSKYTIKL